MSVSRMLRLMKCAKGKPAASATRYWLLSCLVVLTSFTAPALAQGDGPRVYWKSLAGTNAVTFWPVFVSGNANPLDPSHTVDPNSDFQANLGMLGFHKMLPVFKRSATLSGFIPVGNVHGEVSTTLASVHESSSGFGDPMLQMDLNLVGAPAMLGLAQYFRYEPKFTLDVLGDLAFPIGEYDHNKRLNLGQHRWYGRIGAPLMFRLGDWVPGKRTTLEALPAVWLFSENNDYVGGTLKNDPIFQLEGHVTRNLTENFWGSFDVRWFKGGKPTTSNSTAVVTGKSLNTTGVGFTFGYQINDNLQIGASYFSSVADNHPQDLRADEFRITLNYGWHKLIEGTKRMGKH